MTAPLPPGDHALTVTSTADSSDQPYRLYVPTAVEKAGELPLVVVLHGKGVDHNAWFDLTPVKAVAEQFGYLVVAPNGRGDSYYAGIGERDVLDMIARTKRDFRVDDDRVYLAGHSMGGWGTWHIGLRNPHLFAAICPMAGMVPAELLPNARYLAPFVIHDFEDDVVPVTESREPARRLAELGVSFQYREESGYGHSSKLIGDNLPRVFEWFEQHRRVRRPQRVTYAVKPGESGRAYWVGVPETAEWLPSVFSLDARMDSPGRVTISAGHLISVALDLSGLPLSGEGPLEVVVDGCSLEITRRSGWAVLTRTPSSREWKCELRESWQPEG